MRKSKEQYFFYPLGDSPTSPNTEIPPTGHGGKVVPEPPALAAEGTPSTSSIPLVQNGLLWGGVILCIVILAIAIAVAIIRKKSSNKMRRHATAGREGRPLMTSSKLGEFQYPASTPHPGGVAVPSRFIHLFACICSL